MTATLGTDLVFNVASGSAELDQAFDRAGDIEGRSAKAGINVHHQRQIAHIGNAANVGQHVVQRVDAQIRQAQRASRDTATRQVDGAVAGALGQQSVVGVDGADDLQRLFFTQGLAETGACRCQLVLAHLGLQITRYKNVVSVVLRWVGSTKANAVPSSNMGGDEEPEPRGGGNFSRGVMSSLPSRNIVFSCFVFQY